MCALVFLILLIQFCSHGRKFSLELGGCCQINCLHDDVWPMSNWLYTGAVLRGYKVGLHFKLIIASNSFNINFSGRFIFQTLNDWYDREIDAINEPYRPIPSGAISENEACNLYFSFAPFFGTC